MVVLASAGPEGKPEMEFNARHRVQARPTLQGATLAGIRGALLLAGRLVITAATLLLIAAALLYMRLTQGPLELPVVAQIAEQQIAAADLGHSVRIGGIVLTLDHGDGASLIQLRDVAIADRWGRRMFEVPRVGFTMGLADLLQARIRPSRVVVRGPEVRVVRQLAGTLRLQVGKGTGVSLAPAAMTSSEGEDRDEAEEVERVVAQLSGEALTPAFMEALRSVRIEQAALTYDDRILGSVWLSEGATLELVRFDGGARAVVSADVIEADGPSASVRLIAERLVGQDETNLRAAFGQIRTSVLAAQLPALAWLSVLDGTVEGRASAKIDNAGAVTALSGTIISEQGRLKGFGEAASFNTAELRFEVDPARDLVTLERAVLSSRAVDTAMRGVAEIRRDADGAVTGLVGQLKLDRLYADLPSTFSDPIAFSTGEVNFRWSLDKNLIEIADSTLQRGDLLFQLDGRAFETESGWITDLRAEAQNMNVQGLLAHWPLAAARTARDWIADNIRSGEIPVLLAQMRFGGGEPQLSLDFRFRETVASYLDDMSLIEHASGRGHMSYHDLFLFFDAGEVTPPGATPLQLGGSTVAIRDFWGEVTPAFIEIAARGDVSAVLDLLDQPPLKLISKLGVGFGRPTGQADVRATIDFPLIRALLLEQINAQGRAELTGLSTSLDLPGQGPVSIAGQTLRLSAGIESLRLSGGVTLDGIPTQIDWRENYGAKPGRRSLDLRVVFTADLAARLGMGDLPIEGQIPLSVELTQTDGQPGEFQLSADLGPAGLAITPVGWRKAPGTPGQIQASGTIGDGLSIRTLNVETGGLRLAGQAELTAQGGLSQASVSQLIIPGFADISGSLRLGPDGVPELTVDGGTLDLSRQLEGAGDPNEAGTAVRVGFVLDRLTLNDAVMLTGTRGRFARDRAGSVTSDIAGLLGGVVPLDAEVDKPAGARGSLKLASPDAGAALEALDLYRGATGGALVLDAAIGGPGDPTLEGSLQIEDLLVRSESTFSRVLSQGGLEEAGAEVQGAGLGFRKVLVPFVYQDDVLTLSDAIATSPALALKISGTLNAATDTLDLAGIMSPAYALTGALNQIPLLGKILSGGEGEGILAMTFRLEGQMRDPNLSVNPLSILTPGFLRNIFRGGPSGNNSGFVERLRQGQDR